MMIIVCGLLTAMGAFHMDPINSTLPTIAKALNTAGNSTLMVTSGFFYGMMIGHVVVGPFSDVIGRKKTIVLGFILLIIGALIGANANNLGMLICARMVQGLGGAGVMCTARAIGGDAGKGAASARALSLMQIFAGVTPVFLPLVGQAVGASLGWQAIFYLMVFMDAVLLVLTLIFVKETSQTSGAGAWKKMATDFKSCMATPEFLCFTLTFAFSMALFFCYTGAASFAMQNELHMTSGMFSIMYSVNGASMIVGGIIGTALNGKFKPQNVLRIIHTIQGLDGLAICILFATHAATIPLLWALWCIIPLTQAISLPTGMALGLNAAGRITGSGAAFMGFVQYCFSSISTTILSNIKATGSMGSAAGLIMLICAVSAILFCTLGVHLLKKRNPTVLA